MDTVVLTRYGVGIMPWRMQFTSAPLSINDEMLVVKPPERVMLVNDF